MNAAQSLPDLTGWTAVQAVQAFEEAGFTFHHTTRGGYNQFNHSDGSQIWVKPNGEVVRLGPKVKGRASKKYRRRFDQHGNQTKLHSSGEKLVKE
jgi:predicted RNA binding protein YcfA (HicA-like mRNA interferase family)